MEKNISLKRVSYLIGFMLVAVFNVVLSACQENDRDDYDRTVSFSEETIKKTPATKDYNFTVRRDSANYGKKAIMSWTTYETTTNVEAKSQMTVEASHAFDENAVMEEDMNKVIDLAYAQAHTTYSEVKADRAIGYVQNNYTYSQRATALLGDGGTQCYLDMEAVIPQLNLGEKFYAVAADSIIFGKAYVKSLEFVEKTMTRAAEFYIDKEHPFFVRIVWGVPFETVNLEKNYKAEVEVSDTIMDYPLVLNDIIDVKVDTSRVVLDETTERGEIYLQFIHKNKEIDEANVIIPMRYGIETIPEYLKDVTSFDYHHTKDNPFEVGSAYTPADMQQDYVTYSERAVKFSGDATNGYEPINTPYVFRSQKARYYRKYGNFTVDVTFDFILPEMNEKNTYVQSIASEDKKYDMARFYNKINVTYQGFYQEAQETVKLRKKAEGVEWEGFESLDGTRTIFNDSIVWIPRYRKDFRDGTSVRSSARHSDVRLHEILTDWLSTEENESQTTNNLWLGDSSYKKMSVDIDGFRFEWERETRYGFSDAKLFGSTQNNKGRFIEPVRMTVTYLESGKSITYTDLEVNTSNSASVSGAGESEGYKLYNYRDQWSYKLGTNTLQLVAPGTIKVKMADPDPTITFKGFVSTKITVSYNGTIVREAIHLKQWNNGKEERKEFTLTTGWSVKATSSWDRTEENNTQSTNNAVLTVTSKNAETKKVNGATFKYNSLKATAKSVAKLAGSSQNNTWALVYEEGASSIEYDGDTADFDQLVFNISNSATVTGGNQSGDYYVYDYADKLGANLNGQTQYASAPGIIRVKVEEEPQIQEPTITYKGFTSTKLTVTNNTILREAEHLTKWSDGKEERKNFSLTTSWSVNATTNWSSIESNNTQSTTSATQSVTSRNTETKSVNGATFTYTKVNATAKSTAKLAGSNQQNGWTLVYEEGSSSIEYDGDVANFDNLTFNLSNSASVSGGTKVNGYYEYNYADKLGASLNGQTQYASAPGLIKIKAKEPSFFPEEWGKLVKALQTVANNEGHTSYVYTWSLHFENGYVLPVVVRPGSISPEYHFEYVEKTSITTYNGGSYQSATNKWINTYAQDEPNHMKWSRNSTEVANQNQVDAKACHWDEDHKVNGKYSVNTSRYSLTITNGKLSATDTYTNTYMGTWSSYVGD